MADIGNQLEGVGDGLDRFLGALDDASYKLGSNAALQATQARAAKKMQAQDIRFKKRLDKIETDHAKQIKTMQPVYKKLWTGIKDEVKQRSLLSKGMKDMTKSMTDFAKKAIGGIGKGIMAIGKAGVLGGMVAAIKLITDGLFRTDAAMAKLAGRVKMTREELGGVHTAAKGAQASMSQFGVTIEQTLATSGNLVEAFGSAKYVTDQLLETATRLELAYGLSAEASSGLVEHLTRANVESRTFIDNIANKATAAGVSASLVMRDMASQTQKMAMHGERGVDAMVQMAVTAAKAGTSMKAFDGAAAAFSDMDTITSGLGDLGARFGQDFVKGVGRPEDLYWAFFEGGQAAKDANNKITQSMVDQFEWSEKKGLLDKKGRKVEEGWIKKMAAFRGMEVEDMMRIYKTQERLSKMKPAEIAAEEALAAKKKSALERENEVLISQKTIIKNLQGIWTGLYSTLSSELDEIFGISGTAGSGIKAMGEGLKKALNLEFFAEDIKKDKGGWGFAIKTRIKTVMREALSTVFPDFAKELEGAGGGIDGFIAVVKAKLATAIKSGIYDAFGVDVDLGSLAKTAASTAGVMGAVGGVAKALSMIKGTFLNPMWVKMAGGIPGMGGGGAPTAGGAAGKGGMLASLKGFFGKKSSFAKGIGKFTTALSSSPLAKGFLKKLPWVGTMIFAAEGIMAASDKMQATTEEQHKEANKRMGGAAGGAGGMAAGAAAGAAIGSIVPIVGTAIGGLIGAALGGWLGAEGGMIIADKWDSISGWFMTTFEGPINAFKGWIDTLKNTWTQVSDWFKNTWTQVSDWFKTTFEGPINSFKGWIDGLKEIWANIERIAISVWSIGKSVFNIISHYAGEMKDWFNDKVITPLGNFASAAATLFNDKVITPLGNFATAAATLFNDKVITPLGNFATAAATLFNDKVITPLGNLASFIGEKISSALTSFANAFSWENINKMLKVIVPGYGAISAAPEVLANVSASAADALSGLAGWFSSKEKEITEGGKVEEPVNGSALGRIGGGLSLVGEAGGEVVASRSALRSGIGIGGRAASALAGIGVPGYREGYARMDVSGIHGRQGLSGAQGSQEFRQARASAFEQEQLRQQAAMLNYWRNTYDQKMDALIDETKRENKKGPSWLQKAFKEYNLEIGFALNKALKDKTYGKEMTVGIMAGMTKWSEGGSLSDAISVGAKAGIAAGLSDTDSGLYKLTERMGEFADTVRTGLAAFASGQNPLRAMAGVGAHALAGKVFGGDATSMAAQYMGMGTMGGGMPGMPSARQGSHMALRSAIGMPQAAKGKYVNSPTLMMVGEGGASEVVIPTDRIRKGLPINAGVAAELGSIGVPGFVNGGRFGSANMPGGGGIGIRNTGALPSAPLATPSLGIGKSAVESRSSGYGAGVSGRFDDLGGFGGMAKAGGAAGLMTFGNIFQQTGDWKQAATGGVGAGIGVGAGMGLTALGIPPPLSGMVGNMIGGLATKGLNSVFNITGGYGEGRRKTLKKLESHIKTGGRFDYGAPSGLNKAMTQAVGGYEKTPTEANFQKLTEKLGTSKLVSSMGVPAPTLIALGMGQMRGEAATKMFSSINTSLYGKDGGDKYRNALAIPSLAAGGIVNRPTTALIGEAGPEAVIPLRDSEMVQELKKQNKLMVEMIKTQKETAKTEIRMDGRIVAETVGQNMYNIGTGM